MFSGSTSRRRLGWQFGAGLVVAATALALWALGPAQAGPADAAHVALREAATWAACIDRKILDPELDAELVDLTAVSHIDNHFLRQTGRRALDWTPLNTASYRQLGFALVQEAEAGERERLCAQAKLRTLRFLREGAPPAAPRAKDA